MEALGLDRPGAMTSLDQRAMVALIAVRRSRACCLRRRATMRQGGSAWQRLADRHRRSVRDPGLEIDQAVWMDRSWRRHHKAQGDHPDFGLRNRRRAEWRRKLLRVPVGQSMARRNPMPSDTSRIEHPGLFGPDEEGVDPPAVTADQCIAQSGTQARKRSEARAVAQRSIPLVSGVVGHGPPEPGADDGVVLEDHHAGRSRVPILSRIQ